MALSGDEPIPNNAPQYVPVFPFYEAEPMWFYKGYGTSGGDGGDDDLVVLFSETVTTTDNHGDNIAELSYSQLIDADTITVTFDRTEYTCPCINVDVDGAYAYGGFNDGADFTEYPFFIWSDSQVNQLVTQTAGEHTITVKAHLL